MAIKFEKIQPGMTLWVGIRRKMGNTRISKMTWDPRHIAEVDSAKRRVRAEWNGRSMWVPESRCTKWRATKPEPKKAGA